MTGLATETRESPAEPIVGAMTRHDLEQAHPTQDERELAFFDAVGRFSGALKVSPPAVKPPDLANDRLGRPLFLQMAALSAVLDSGAHQSRRAEPDLLLQDALLRERGFWLASAAVEGLDIRSPELERAVAVACLADVGSEIEAAEILRAIPELSGDGEGRRRYQVAQWLHALYRQDKSGGWLPSLDPDLLAEAHISAVLGDTKGLASRAVAAHPPARTSKALGALSRAGRDHVTARDALVELLTEQFERLARPAIEVAQQAGDPIGLVLAEVLSRDTRPELVDVVFDALPTDSVSLLEVSVVATQSVLERARDSMDVPSTWNMLVRLSNQLSKLGREDEALSAIEEAARIIRGLAAKEPTAWQEQLAGTLTNLSGRLVRGNRYDEAISAGYEAISLLRTLSADRVELVPQLAGTLNNQSISLAAVGSFEDALVASREAVVLLRGLSREETGTFVPELAGCLQTHSARLAEMGLLLESLTAGEESIAIYRDLAALRPDAFRRDLAGVLSDLSGTFAELGRTDEAINATEEAVAILRELAVLRPSTFLPDPWGGLEQPGWKPVASRPTRGSRWCGSRSHRGLSQAERQSTHYLRA